MLTLHNWGGTDCVGTASPVVLARKLNVVAICVNYLQSGQVDSIQGPEPYDFGYLQDLTPCVLSGLSAAVCWSRTSGTTIAVSIPQEDPAAAMLRSWPTNSHHERSPV